LDFGKSAFAGQLFPKPEVGGDFAGDDAAGALVVNSLPDGCEGPFADGLVKYIVAKSVTGLERVAGQEKTSSCGG
jgi:hypothetical protein